MLENVLVYGTKILLEVLMNSCTSSGSSSSSSLVLINKINQHGSTIIIGKVSHNGSDSNVVIHNINHCSGTFITILIRPNIVIVVVQ